MEEMDPLKASNQQQKRIRAPSEPPVEPENSLAKKAKAGVEAMDIPGNDLEGDLNENLCKDINKGEKEKIDSPLPNPNDDSNIGNESDSDADYDDLDDLVLPSDAEQGDDLMEDDCDGVDLEDDTRSVTSTATTISSSSVGSNTPSLVGESLETVSIGSGEGVVKRKAAWVSQAPNLTDSPALRRSLFSNIPPTINFMLHNEMSAHQLPDDLRKQLKWKLSNITPAIVKRCASNSGFRLMRKTCSDWTATWGKHMKSPMFKEIKEGQKINHFPGTFNIGRKDRLWKNYHRLMLKFGKTEFGFLPRTFCLPADTKLLRKVWERKGGKGRWIVKPPALARGTGIKVVNKWSQIPRTRPLVVQRYVARPYLINQTKFDLRLYVLMTSINPLRLYLYDDGLVRFASNKYSNESTKVGDVYTHLTNYSINKNSASYMSNEDSARAQGHKWTLKSLWRHFDAEGIDHTVIWEKIQDLIIKTILSAENSMATLFQQNLGSRYCCYELFGFDILLDSNLKPWLIEVNISPSLHSTSTLDLDVKSPLATEVFNMARYHIPNRLRLKDQKEIAEKMGYHNMPTLCHERKLYIKEMAKAERAKHEAIVQQYNASADESLVPPMGVLDSLTPDDTRQLIVSEDELATSRRFARIFPTSQSYKYFKFMDKPRYYNLLLSAWEQRYSGMNREAGRTVLENLCLSKHHLKVPANVYVKKTALGTQETIDISGLAAPGSDEGSKIEGQGDSLATSLDSQGSLTSSQDNLPNSQESLTISHNSLTSSQDCLMNIQGGLSNSQYSLTSSQDSLTSSLDSLTSSRASCSDSNNSLTVVSAAVQTPDSPAPLHTSPTKTVKMSNVRVVAKPYNVKTVSPAANRSVSKVGKFAAVCPDVGEDSSSLMEWGSDTPSPKGTPEHPGVEEPEMHTGSEARIEVVDNIQVADSSVQKEKLDNENALRQEVDNRPVV